MIELQRRFGGHGGQTTEWEIRIKDGWEEHYRALFARVMEEEYLLVQVFARAHTMGIFLPEWMTPQDAGAIAGLLEAGDVWEDELRAALRGLAARLVPEVVS